MRAAVAAAVAFHGEADDETGGGAAYRGSRGTGDGSGYCSGGGSSMTALINAPRNMFHLFIQVCIDSKNVIRATTQVLSIHDTTDGRFRRQFLFQRALWGTAKSEIT
ncbi:unnamed protein product, partial [Pylaiella littoralis]